MGGDLLGGTTLYSPVQPESHWPVWAPRPRPSLVRTVCICSAANPQRFQVTRNARLTRQSSGERPPRAAGRRAARPAGAVSCANRQQSACVAPAICAPGHAPPGNLAHPGGSAGGMEQACAGRFGAQSALAAAGAGDTRVHAAGGQPCGWPQPANATAAAPRLHQSSPPTSTHPHTHLSQHECQSFTRCGGMARRARRDPQIQGDIGSAG